MELFEQVSGARMHTALYRPADAGLGVLTHGFVADLARFLTKAARAVSGAFLGLINSRSLKTRLSFVGQLSKQRVLTYGITGITARSAGLFVDLRLSGQTGYGVYRNLSLRSFIGYRGDNLDRFLLRIKESAESLKVLAQLLAFTDSKVSTAGALESVVSKFFKKPRLIGLVPLPKNVLVVSVVLEFIELVTLLKSTVGLHLSHRSVFSSAVGISLIQEQPVSRSGYGSMEALIEHFKTASTGWMVQPGIAYGAVESPKGEVGVTLFTNLTSRPVRVKLRTPVSHNMHLIPAISKGAFFADFVATFCSLDIVLGEIDR
jgi:NADH:ubiquinone oxidoreductase subunit D